MIPKKKKHKLADPEKNGEARCENCKNFREQCKSRDGKTVFGFCDNGKPETLKKNKEFIPYEVCADWICLKYTADE